MNLPYEPQPLPDPADNLFTLFRTLAKCVTLLTMIGVTVHFLLPLRESFIKSQSEPITSTNDYQNPRNKPHLKGQMK